MSWYHRRGTLFAIVAIGLLFSCAACVSQSQVDRAYVDGGRYEDDSDLFYDDLAPYGHWVNHRTYGRVWYPLDVPMGWRPYSDGHWEYSRDYGWVWESDRPWGWAPFHYGRWAFDDWYGWVWVPGREWAPAWVVWRYGNGYAAWAPMPPTALWRPGRGVDRRYFRPERDLDWDCWVAVPERHLHDREMRRHILGQRDNVWLVKRASTVVFLAPANGRVVNQGVPVGHLERVTARPIPRVRVYEVDRHDARDGHREEDGVRAIRPRFRPLSSGDIRREAERAEALSAQQERQELERRQEGTPRRGSEPRKAGRLGNKAVTPEVSVPEPQGEGSSSLPSPALGRGRAPRGGADEGVDQVRQPLVRENTEPAPPDSVPAVAPQEVRRPRTPAKPVRDQKRSPADRGRTREVPQPEEQKKMESGGQPSVGQSDLTVPAPSEAQALPVELRAVPQADSDSGLPRVREREHQPERRAPQSAPVEARDSVPLNAPQEVILPTELRTVPVEEDQRIEVPEESPGTMQGGNRDQRRQRFEHIPQGQVDPPVPPTPPEAPLIPLPQAPVPPEVFPPHGEDRPRGGRDESEQHRSPEKQAIQGGMPVPGLEQMPTRSQQVEAPGQLPGEAVRGKGDGKRNKKGRRPQEEGEEEEQGAETLPPQPQL